MENKSIKFVRFIIQIVVGALFIILGIAELSPGMGTGFLAVIFILFGVVILPIKPLDEVLEKHKITLGTRIYFACVVFIILAGYFILD